MKLCIVITLYRRPRYTKELFRALSCCYNFDYFDLLISCDFNGEYRNACEQVYQEALKFIDQHKRFGQVLLHNPRLGIDLNKLHAIPMALSTYKADGFILLEDDTIPSPDALNFFATNLLRFRDDPEIFAICGYNRIPGDNLGKEDEGASFEARSDPYGIYRYQGFKPWGWAMTTPWWESLFAHDAKTYRKDTGEEMNGRFDWWLSWGAQSEKRYCIRPVLARMQSIGGEEGEHTPSAAWHKENEYNRWGAWDLDLPDNGLFTWEGQYKAL